MFQKISVRGEFKIYETDISIEKNVFSLEKYSRFALVSDIGGTNTPIAIFGRRKEEEEGKKIMGGADAIDHIFTLKWDSKKIKNITDCINETLKFAYDNYSIRADMMNSVLAVAGPIESKRRYSKPTNLRWHVDAEEIKKNTYLKNIELVNDFEAIGFAMDLLTSKDVVQLNDAVDEEGTMAIIGAGTGLGTSILHYDAKKKQHIPIRSEGGHLEVQAADPEDEKIIRFIRKKNALRTVTYEMLVSGPGLAAIYDYFSSKKLIKSKVHRQVLAMYDRASMIANNCRTDKTCRQAMDTFLRFYGRAAKNVALMSIPKGGLFIAGGIAPKIINELQNRIFIREFEENPKMSDLLRRTPVFVIMNPKIGLIGAANAALNFFDDLVE